MSKNAAELKKEILKLTREYSALMHGANRPGDDHHQPFEAGKTTVPYAGRVFTEDEVEAAVGSTLDFWLTLGAEGEAMEKELAEFIGVKKSILVNSGSSANLVAFSALTSHKIQAEKRIRPGDEVITCAAGFPTTVAPILQNGAVPVFLDNNPYTGNADLSRLEEAYVPGKTKAVMIAHALGNPFDLSRALEFCKKHDLWLIEDNCDALGCTYSMPLEKAEALSLAHLQDSCQLSVDRSSLKTSIGSTIQPINDSTSLLTRLTGTWGDISTQSFYPPHHLTMGEGGAVNIVHEARLKVYAESFRDWGRDCWCASGKDNTCNARFNWQLGELPKGYDHKYIYSHMGYNLKPLDPQAAIGRIQLQKLPSFIEARKNNWETLRSGLAGLEEFFEFSLPTHAVRWVPPSQRNPATNNQQPTTESQFDWDSTGCQTDCSWFGFMMLVRPDAPFTRTDFAKYLDEHKIGNRMLFGGNLLRQPAFVQLRKDNPKAFRIVGESPNQQPATSNKQLLLPGADRIMNESIFIGVYPGLTPAMLAYMVETIVDFVKKS